MTEKPQYVQETEQHLGLELVQSTEDRYEWWVMAPTGVKLFKIGSRGSGTVIGMVSQPQMYNLQGITKTERHRRYSEEDE